VQQRRDDENAEIAAEDQDSDAPGDQPFVHEDEEKRAEQQLVRDWIEILSEQRALMQDARQQPIQPVADTGHNKEREGDLVVVVQHCHHQEGDDAEAQEGKLVGRSPKVS
jgi:hypothetical protein